MLVAIPAQAGRFLDIPFQVHHIHVCLPKSNKPKKDIFLDFKSYQSCLIYFWHQFTIILIQEQISYERYRFKFCRNAYYLFNNAIQIQNRNSWKHIQLSAVFSNLILSKSKVWPLGFKSDFTLCSSTAMNLITAL